MNSRIAQILRIMFCGVGILGCFWIVFRIFSPSELWLIIVLGIIVFCAYGLQLNTWPESSTHIRWFGLLKETEVSVYQQMTLFGLINISKRRRIKYISETHCPLIQKAANQAMELAFSTVSSALPFGGVFGKKIALTAIGYKKAIGS